MQKKKKIRKLSFKLQIKLKTESLQENVSEKIWKRQT